jgi:hypothetical protein
MPQPEQRQVLESQTPDPGWKSLYRVGGITALILVVFPLVEVVIGFLPGVAGLSRTTVSVTDWFALFQNHWFLALRNLGLLNIVGAAFFAPTILAIYSALRRDHQAYAALGTILFFVGLAVYLAGSRVFPMLSLSSQYAVAATDAQRALLAAAGQAMLAEGQSRAGVPLIEFACLLISAVMLRGRVFSKATAWAGILGNALLIVVEIITTIARGLPTTGFVVAIFGGLSIVTWYLLVGRKLLQLART